MPESAITSAACPSCFKVQLEAQDSHPTWLAQFIDKDYSSHLQIFSKPNIACDLLLRNVPGKTFLICNNLEKSQLLLLLRGPDFPRSAMPEKTFCFFFFPWSGPWFLTGVLQSLRTLKGELTASAQVSTRAGEWLSDPLNHFENAVISN